MFWFLAFLEMDTAEVATQTKRSALKPHSKRSVTKKVEVTEIEKNIKSCEFEVFGIVQGMIRSYLTEVNIQFNAVQLQTSHFDM